MSFPPAKNDQAMLDAGFTPGFVGIKMFNENKDDAVYWKDEYAAKVESRNREYYPAWIPKGATLADGSIA